MIKFRFIRIDKIILSFVLPILCLLINVSYATFDMNSQPSATTTYSDSADVSTPFIEEFTSKTGYTPEEVLNTAQYKNSSNETQKQLYITTLDSCSSAGYHIVTDGSTVLYIYPNSEGFDIGVNSYFCLSMPLDYSYMQIATHINRKRVITCTSAGRSGITFSETFHNSRVKSLTSSYTWDESRGYYFEPTLVNPVGTYYAPGTEPDTPSLPSNAEIAQSVQLFYNTIYNQPNIAFDDFIVLYDVSTGLYSYIGHTRGNAIGQVIVEPNGYYNGYKFDKQWWQFFLDEQNDSWEWQNITKYNNYYLYTSQGDIDTLEFVGKDKIDNLFTSGPWATSNTVIVYSTNDYPVKYITFSDESPDPVVEEGTIKGDQYTYDENLDITDNQYNPLDNFVSIDYPSTLVSRAEFDKFMETFDENKDFLILPTDSNWIIIACNSLFNHFSSFVIMCAVFIIVERIMRG